jgi:hypothetical protein
MGSARRRQISPGSSTSMTYVVAMMACTAGLRTVPLASLESPACRRQKVRTYSTILLGRCSVERAVCSAVCGAVWCGAAGVIVTYVRVLHLPTYLSPQARFTVACTSKICRRTSEPCGGRATLWPAFATYSTCLCWRTVGRTTARYRQAFNHPGTHTTHTPCHRVVDSPLSLALALALWSAYSASARVVSHMPSVLRCPFHTIQASRLMESAFAEHGRALPHLIGPGMGHAYHEVRVASHCSAA